MHVLYYLTDRLRSVLFCIYSDAFFMVLGEHVRKNGCNNSLFTLTYGSEAGMLPLRDRRKVGIM